MLSLAKYKCKYDKISVFLPENVVRDYMVTDNVLFSSAPIIRNNPKIVINTDAVMGGVPQGKVMVQSYYLTLKR